MDLVYKIIRVYQGLASQVTNGCCSCKEPESLVLFTLKALFLFICLSLL